MNMILISIGGHVLTAALLLTNWRIIHLAISQPYMQHAALTTPVTIFSITTVMPMVMITTSIGGYVPSAAFLLINGYIMHLVTIPLSVEIVVLTILATTLVTNIITVMSMTLIITGGYVAGAVLLPTNVRIMHLCDKPTICSDCGASYSGDNIIHNYSNEYQFDNYSHWRACSKCGDIFLKASHTTSCTSTFRVHCLRMHDLIYQQYTAQ